MPRGATNAKPLLNIAEDSRTKKSVTQIKNKDSLCCPRAVIVGLRMNWSNNLSKKLRNSYNAMKRLLRGINI
jgi:RNase H-fold protein (predicted Holliday junction resolvase)